MNRVEYEDLVEIIESEEVKWEKFDANTFLITGGTGLIGSIMAKLFLLRNRIYNSNIKIVLLVRDRDRSREQLSTYPGYESVRYIEKSIENINISELGIDYIVHTAAPTKSSFFVNNPVETIESIVLGTMNVLNLARVNNVKSMVNVSSMESYGTIECDNVEEDNLGLIPLTSLRSSYPESKRLTELLAYSYSQEYNVNVTSLRLAQTFGAGITKNENRVFKYFCDCIIKNDDIVLKSTGETVVNFCYLTDALKAILVLLADGDSGEIYNASGDSDSMRIKDVAQWLIDEYGSNQKVVFDLDESTMYAPINKMQLNSDKIKKIGWSPKIEIREAYSRLLESLTIDERETNQ
ncbi:NAD(P)-dependent oxidoreductase [Erysipelothrix piscisicarius]|uniref:NAD(P)-dependent oxidoreductase n=1 Tax=Erysipelothrix piscisicarius TaxID=2485784 RepID=A0A3Q8S6I5_9FIRM|nr:NAD(P)-dependent oxidoreductase [Erysipelothrix piscisicarius]AZK43499.1 NAD(P)-dependent oxidoreductase [Erysipelothrix piscisicarius]